ncbi:Bacterial extracellular solute-binding protein, family 3 [Pseudodesulfovibrio hydrargyri]|uniref:Bacterial extracellular solute-binding protein, family 3 n=1 Tax=Pseudodesulfovibrio hydrargyri TaxID=2125990 RepID=A0A1J5N7P5_9BACT|nr:transporter substrate-binding domain-containing protein [Pseudodesulfovibrio hydrargyri]OIQ49319.1 Bacterial extracellular solute-binding protein, family 3 [Pseudodesulfovibrio hydrargyri]
MWLARLIAAPLFVGLFLASPGFAQVSNDPAAGITYLAEVYRPFIYMDKGRPVGLAVDLLKLLWQEMNVPEQPIEVMPWPRIYESGQWNRHVAIFSVYRTKEREKLFKWVGPIAKGRQGLFCLCSRGLEMRSPGDMTGLGIASLRDTASTSKVLQAGIIPTYAANAEHAVQLLRSGRVDAIALDETRFRRTIAAMGFSAKDFETALILSEDPLYYAFSPDAEDTLIDRFQRALDAVTKRPVYRALLTFYADQGL